MKSNLSTNLAYMYCVFTGNHTITVLKTSEDYKNLRNGKANVTLTVNKPIDDGFIVMNGKRVIAVLLAGWLQSTMYMTQ